MLLVKRPAISGDLESKGSSEIAGILLKLTVSLREIIVIPKVALNKGSSQHGNKRLAAVGCQPVSESMIMNKENRTNLELSQCIVFLHAINFVGAVVVLL